MRNTRITFWMRLRLGLMLAVMAFRKGFEVGNLYLAKGDTLSVTYSLKVK